MIEKVSKKIKFLAAVMGSLLITSVSAFGMYGYGDGWIDFLTHGNQFRARMNQLGFVLGNGTIKGTFGFKADTGNLGAIFGKGDAEHYELHILKPTVSGGIGYTSDMISVGLGYNYTYISHVNQIHTPVFMLNALNNNLRLVVPIQVSVGNWKESAGASEADINYTSVAFNNIQLRYYTGIDAFNAVRFYVYYKNDSVKAEEGNTKYEGTKEQLGFQLRLYFLNTQIGNVTVNPFLRAEFHTALKGGIMDDYNAQFAYGRDNVANSVTAGNNWVGKFDNKDVKQSDIYDVNPYRIKIQPVLSLAASSDIVSLYFEPSLGYSYTYYKTKADQNGKYEEFSEHSLVWGAYAEMYITPVKDLEWYFEMDVQGNTSKSDISPVSFAGSTGITWYLPSLGGAQ